MQTQIRNCGVFFCFFMCNKQYMHFFFLNRTQISCGVWPHVCGVAFVSSAHLFLLYGVHAATVPVPFWEEVNTWLLNLSSLRQCRRTCVYVCCKNIVNTPYSTLTFYNTLQFIVSSVSAANVCTCPGVCGMFSPPWAGLGANGQLHTQRLALTVARLVYRGVHYVIDSVHQTGHVLNNNNRVMIVMLPKKRETPLSCGLFTEDVLFKHLHTEHLIIHSSFWNRSPFSNPSLITWHPHGYKWINMRSDKPAIWPVFMSVRWSSDVNKIRYLYPGSVSSRGLKGD